MAKILIVDDSAFARNNLRLIAESGSHDVIGQASNGEQALELYKRLQPELVMLDFLMEDKDGVTVLAEMLAHDPTARVIDFTPAGPCSVGESGRVPAAPPSVGNAPAALNPSPPHTHTSHPAISHGESDPAPLTGWRPYRCEGDWSSLRRARRPRNRVPQAVVDSRDPNALCPRRLRGPWQRQRTAPSGCCPVASARSQRAHPPRRARTSDA